MSRGGRWKRWVACADNHGDMADADAVAAFRRFVGDYRPQIRIHLGDAVDLRWLRRGATDEERREDVEADFEAGCEFLRWYEPTAYLFGNHEHRLARGLENSLGAMRNLCQAMLDTLAEVTPGATRYPYCKRRGVHRVGGLACVHGYCSGMYAARQSAIAYGQCIFGHVHTVSRLPVEGIPAKEGRSIGCLCRLDMPYNHAQLGTLRQQHGWAYGETDGDRTVVFQAEGQHGRWNV